MPILSSISTRFGSEVSLTNLLALEDTMRKRVEANNSSKNCNDTIDTESCSEWSYSSLEDEVSAPKSIMKTVSSYESIESNHDGQLQSWIQQPIPDCAEQSPNTGRKHRRTNTSQISPNKYDSVKTPFPGREGRRSRREPKIRGPKTEKTIEEQWVKTCRCLW